MREKLALDQYNNDWFKKDMGASGLKRFCWYFVNVLFFVNPLNPSSALKKGLLRLFGAKIGKGVLIKPGVNIKFPWKLLIGDYCWIGEKVWIDNLAPVEIGAHVCISQGAMLLTGNHDYTKKQFDLMIAKIVLENGVWIGARSLVCPGIVCAEHSVLAAQSVATKNLEAYSVYQGDPAIFVKERTIH